MPNPGIAGRALDAEIAEKVMGLEVERDYPCGIYPDSCSHDVPDTRGEANDFHNERHPIYWIQHENGWRQGHVVPFYSTDIAAAWEVVDALGGIVRITRLASEWHVQFQGGRECWAEGAPLAICYAALSAVEQREASDA